MEKDIDPNDLALCLSVIKDRSKFLNEDKKKELNELLIYIDDTLVSLYLIYEFGPRCKRVNSSLEWIECEKFELFQGMTSPHEFVEKFLNK